MKYDSGGSGIRPPVLAERLLVWRLASPEREYLLGDLEERFSDIVMERSLVRARVWYWRQALIALLSPRLSSGAVAGSAWTGLGGDLRLAWRTIRRRPVQSGLAVGALAIGIGLAGSAFSILDGTVLRGLPFEASARLVHFERANHVEGNLSMAVTPHDWLDWRAEQRSFEDLGAYVEAVALVPGENEPPTRYSGVFISANSFGLLRVRAAVGRTFTAEDEALGSERVVLLSHRLWTRRFGADRDVVGRSVMMNGRPTTVVGVMPEGFGFPIAEQFWFPLRVDPATIQRGTGRLDVFGRLRDGVVFETARVEFASISHRLADAYPATNADVEAVLRSFLDEYVGDDFMRTVWGMLAAATLVLVICCVNVANLLLGHTWRRRRDLAVRTAMGASRGRLVRSLLLEAGLLSAFGAALGIAIAYLGVRWFNVAGAQAGAFALPHGSDSLFWWDVGLDLKTILFVVGAAVVTALVAGLAPAVHVSRSSVGHGLRSQARGGSAGRSFGQLTRGLVVTELALATGLLVAAGFVVESVVNIARENQILDGRGVHVASVSLPLTELGVSEAAYPDNDAHVRFADRMLGAVAMDAAVAVVGFGSHLPFDQPRSVPFAVAGDPVRADEDLAAAGIVVVSPGYFESFGAALWSGRDFHPGDVAGSEPVVIVNRSFADRYLAGRDPVGSQIRLGDSSSTEPVLTVIGIVPDLWSDRLRPMRQAGVYLPLGQSGIGDPSIRLGRFGLRYQNVAVRSRLADPGLALRLRQVVYGLDPDLAVAVRDFDDIVAQLRGRYRVWGRFYFAFAATALFLAALGVYGVLSFSVASRTAEIGIRRALGATAGTVQWAVLRDALIQVGIGVSAGLLVGNWMASGLGRVLYEVDTADPRVFVSVVGVLGVSGLLASWLPARRAANIDPAHAMRND